jgi:hypothetical protein
MNVAKTEKIYVLIRLGNRMPQMLTTMVLSRGMGRPRIDETGERVIF